MFLSGTWRLINFSKILSKKSHKIESPSWSRDFWGLILRVVECLHIRHLLVIWTKKIIDLVNNPSHDDSWLNIHPYNRYDLWQVKWFQNRCWVNSFLRNSCKLPVSLNNINQLIAITSVFARPVSQHEWKLPFLRWFFKNLVFFEFDCGDYLFVMNLSVSISNN